MISFHLEEIVFNLKNKTKLKSWVVSTIEKHPPRTAGSIRAGKKKAGDISFVFCSDAFLLEMNKEYLNHDTYTDIITFDYSGEAAKNNRFSTPLEVTPLGTKPKSTKTIAPISGDIFISIDRVKENANKFSKTFEDELHRVIIHGVLHLLGYKDKTKIAKAEIRKQENFCLKALKKL